MQLKSVVFSLFAALAGTAASTTAQEMEGVYRSTNLDGSPIAEGHTVYITVSYCCTEANGIENYITQAEVVNDATGQVVVTAQPGSLQWDPEARVGALVGSNGSEGWLFDPLPGSGVFVADYSGSGGNVRVWTQL